MAPDAPPRGTPYTAEPCPRCGQPPALELPVQAGQHVPRARFACCGLNGPVRAGYGPDAARSPAARAWDDMARARRQADQAPQPADPDDGPPAGQLTLPL